MLSRFFTCASTHKVFFRLFELQPTLRITFCGLDANRFFWSSCMWYFAMCSRRVHRGSRPRLIFWSLEGPPQGSKPFPSRPQLGSRQGGTGLAGWSAKHSGNAHPAGRCRRFGEHQSGTGGSQNCSLWWRKDVLQHAEDHSLRIIFGGPDVFIAKSKSLKPTVRIFA